MYYFKNPISKVTSKAIHNKLLELRDINTEICLQILLKSARLLIVWTRCFKVVSHFEGYRSGES